MVGGREIAHAVANAAESVVCAGARNHSFAARARFGRAAVVDENDRSSRCSAARHLCQHRARDAGAERGDGRNVCREPSRTHRGSGVRSRAAGDQRICRKQGARRPAEEKNDLETDLSAALEFAATLLPADRPARIVLLSDGVPTAGRNPIETAAQLHNVEIDTVAVQRSLHGMPRWSRSNCQTLFVREKFSTFPRKCSRPRHCRRRQFVFIKTTCWSARFKESSARAFPRSLSQPAG